MRQTDEHKVFAGRQSYTSPRKTLGYLLGDDRCRTLARRIDQGQKPDISATRVEVFLSSACNFHCAYCRSIFHSTPAWETDYLLAELKHWSMTGTRHIHWTGGEPTLHPDLMELVSYTRSLGMNSSMSTNGSALPDTYTRLIKAGMNSIFISLDHIDSVSFDSWTGSRGKLPEIISNILHLSAFNTPNFSCQVVLNLMLTRESAATLLNDQAKGLRALLTWCGSIGIYDFKFLPASTIPFNDIFASAEALNRFLDVCAEVVPEQFQFFHYRLTSLHKGGHGLHGRRHHTCRHFLDDRAFDCVGAYPCIIHLREGGSHLYLCDDPEETIARKIEEFLAMNRVEDPLCYQHCFDVYRDFSDSVNLLLSQKE